jgi:hypothetical protein
MDVANLSCEPNGDKMRLGQVARDLSIDDID